MKYLILLHFIYFKDLIYKKICAPQLTSPQKVSIIVIIFFSIKRGNWKRGKKRFVIIQVWVVCGIYIYFTLYITFIPYTDEWFGCARHYIILIKIVKFYK